MKQSKTVLITGLAVGLAAAGASLRHDLSSGVGSVALAETETESVWTVATMAPDGSWGVGTGTGVGRAIAEAIHNCRKMSSGRIGCGAQAKAIRDGWIVGVRCGDRTILAAERLPADAERAVREREAQLRKLYAPDMAPCTRVLAVGPGGAVPSRNMGRNAPPLTD